MKKTSLSAGWGWGLLSILLASGGMLTLLLLCLRETGDLVYTFDDPYIHMALARSIQQGSYGINPGEWASPSSSILWPFLLALVPVKWMVWAPLVINAVSCVLSVQILRAVMAGGPLPGWLRTLGALAIGFGINLFGLAMSGMEHSLQVLLALFVAWRLVEDRQDIWFYAALAAMPLIRFECMAITVPVAAWIVWAKGDRIRPVLCVAAVLAVMAAFCFFLHSRGLPWLPSSVLSKLGEGGLSQNLEAHHMLPLGLLAFLGFMAWRRGHVLPFIFLVLGPVSGFLTFGRIGWFGRYEAFIVAWLAAFTLAVVCRPVAPGLALLALPRPTPKEPPAGQAWRAFVLPLLAFGVLGAGFQQLWLCTILTPAAALNIKEQHVLMGRLARELDVPIAVNDLGQVAWQSRRHVLDLWGLASADALAARRSGWWNGGVIEELMVNKGVDTAFIYEQWFPPLPTFWIRVGYLNLQSKQVTAGGSFVTLMARTPQAAERLHKLLQAEVERDPGMKRFIEIEPELRPIGG